MGFFQRLLGRDPASRMDKARRFLAEGAFNDARWELEDLDHPPRPRCGRSPVSGS